MLALLLISSAWCSDLTPGERLAGCTAVVFPAVKVDYQCGEVKVAFAELRGFDDPALAMTAMKSTLVAKDWSAHNHTVDSQVVEIVRSVGPDGEPYWVALGVYDLRVRMAICKATGPGDAQSACERVLPLLALYGPVEPVSATPSFAGRTVPVPPGCGATTEPGWHGVFSCSNGSELRWRSTPLLKDIASELASYATSTFLGTEADLVPWDCRVDGVPAYCLQGSGTTRTGTTPRHAAVAYAGVRDDGVLLMCAWNGAPEIPATCAGVLSGPPPTPPTP